MQPNFPNTYTFFHSDYFFNRIMRSSEMREHSEQLERDEACRELDERFNALDEAWHLKH